MLWIEQKYIRLIAGRLDKFKQRSSYLYNCRCIYCHDSQKNKHKARGYIFAKSNAFFYFCHNCGVSKKFPNVLKDIDITLYAEYRRDLLVAKGQNISQEVEDFAPRKYDAEMDLISLADLPKQHGALKYVRSRDISQTWDEELFYAPKYMHWVNEKIPEKFSKELLEKDEPRLVIPLLDHSGKLFGSVGRALDEKSKMRYNTVIFDEEKPKIYGLHRVDFNRQFFLVEGPLDSLFLHNAIAAAGSDLLQAMHKLNVDWSRGIIVFDNERRNPQIIAKMDQAIKRGLRVCMWPENVVEKDINNMVLGGRPAAQIQATIEASAYSGLKAHAMLSKWKRV